MLPANGNNGSLVIRYVTHTSHSPKVPLRMFERLEDGLPSMADAALRIPVYQVDAFGPEPFTGNPAAVCLLQRPLPASVMQNIAREMNLSETAFVERTGTGNSRDSAFGEDSVFGLRWFTIGDEVPLCGHATLAAAAVLFQAAGNQNSALHFETLSGRLTVRQPAGSSKNLQMTLPNCAPTAAPEWLQQASPAIQAALGNPEIHEVMITPKINYVLVVLTQGTSQEQLQSIQPDYAKLKAVASYEQVTGMIVTCAGDGRHHHILSRFFAPWVGITEDPVTGSAHAVLGPYWDEHLKDPPAEMKARQCSTRGGELIVEVKKDIGKVLVSGQAIVVIQGHLLIPSSMLT